MNRLPETCPPELQPAVARYLSGEISAEVTLAQCLLALGDPARLVPALQHLADVAPGCAALLDIAVEHHERFSQITAVLAAQLNEPPPSGEAAIAAWRERYDRAVATAPEAAVALYSLGSPAILDKATLEIVSRLADWRLLGSGQSVLDIGCGIGRIERALSPHVGTITGIDISSNMVAEATRRCTGLANVGFRVCSGRDIASFAPGSFDLVLAVDSLPYVFTAGPTVVERHFAEAAQLLRPSGALLILNFSYRGDLDADRRDVARLAAVHGFAVERLGSRDFALWDGAAFLLRR